MKVDKWFHMYSTKKEIVFEEADPLQVLFDAQADIQFDKMIPPPDDFISVNGIGCVVMNKATLERLRGKKSWNLLSERKPSLFEYVVICSTNGHYHIGVDLGLEKWFIDGMQMCVDELGDFWWMPFPEPPKGESV